MAKSAHVSYRKPFVYRKTVTAAEATATTCFIDIAIGALPASYGGSPANDTFYGVCQVKTSAGVEIPGFKTTYSKTTGKLTIDNNAPAVLAANMVITVIGTWFDS